MQPVGPFQMPGAKVQGLTLGRGIGPQKPQRQARLNRQHHQQGPQAEQAPSASATVRQDLGRRPAGSSAQAAARQVKLLRESGRRGPDRAEGI